MITYASEVVVARPPADVYPYLTEREKQALWSDVPMQPLTEGPLRLGSRMRLSFGRGPLHASLDLEVTGADPDARLAFTTVSQGGVRWDGEYDLAPAEGGGTRVSQRGTMRFSGLWRLLEPMMGAEMKRGEIAELERLKAVLERPVAG